MRVTKTSALRPGKYTAWFAKFLKDKARAEENSCHEDAIECQSESCVSTQIERDGALPDREVQFGSSHGSKALHKPDREKELADSLPCRPYQHIKRVNNRSVNASNNI